MSRRGHQKPCYIVVVSSVQSYGPIRNLLAYCASKIAVNYLCHGIGRDYARDNISVQVGNVDVVGKNEKGSCSVCVR